MRAGAKRYIHAVLMGLLALTVAAFALYAAVCLPGISPRLLSEAGDPMDTAAAFLDALCTGDYAAASALMEGQPDLGLDTLPEKEPERSLSLAFRESWSWQAGALWQQGAEARLPVAFTALDLQAFTEGLDAQILTRLRLRLETAQRQEELYNPDKTWRSEAVYAALDEALAQRLRHREDYYATTQLTLLLRWDGNRWAVVAEDMLYDLLAGEVAP